MERKVLVLLCFVAILTFLFSSCTIVDKISGGSDSTDNGENNEGDSTGDNIEDDTGNQGTDEICEHTFSDKWSSNSIQHWHAVTCEHTSLKADVESHFDTDEDGACDVCAYKVGHEHTYDDAWKYDATHHWRESTCSHVGEKTDLSSHLDTDSDGSCDSCSVHVHVVDIFGKCSVCGEQISDVDISNLDLIVPAVVSNSDKIMGGILVYNYYSSTPSTPGFINNDMTLTYILGNGASYYRTENRSNNYGHIASSTQESWYQLNSDGSVFGVYQQTDGEVKSEIMFDASSDDNKLVGCYYSVSTLASAYGAEDLLSELYRLAKSGNATDFASEYADGEYTFSYSYLYVNFNTADGEEPHTDYFEVEVSFTVSDSGALTYLDVVCDCYSNSLADDIDNDYDYDPLTNTITMRANARPDTYTYSIAQEVGKRTYVSEHPKNEFVPEDFDIYLDSDRTEKVEGTVLVTVGKVFYLYLGNFTPEGTSISYVADKFTAFCPYSDVVCFSNAITSSALFNVKAEGTYTITITAGDVVKEITVTAEKKQTTPVTPPPIPENSVSVEITDTHALNKDFVLFVAPSDGDYTFTIPKGTYLGACTDGELVPWADYNVIDKDTKEPIGGSITVSLKKGESYKFYVFSPNMNITVYISYTLSEYSGEQGDNTNPENPGNNDGTGKDPDQYPTSIEGTYIAHSMFNSDVRVVVDSTRIMIVDPQGRVTYFTYTYVDGVFEVFYNGNKLPNTSDPRFTITNQGLVSIKSNGTFFELEPTDEEVLIEDKHTGSSVPNGTEQRPYVLDTLPESITFDSNASNKNYYKFTAVESGTLTITWPSEDSWGDIFELSSTGATTSKNISAYATSSISLDVVAGTSYRFSIGTWENAGTVTVTLTIE